MRRRKSRSSYAATCPTRKWTGRCTPHPLSLFPEKKVLNPGRTRCYAGSKAEDIQRVESFAQDHHLEVTQVDPASRTVRIRGTLANLQNAFGVELRKYEKEETQFRSHRMPIMVPDTLAGVVQAVLGLDDHPIAKH